MTYPRDRHFRETVERAESYAEQDAGRASTASIARDACATMLFTPTEAEFAEIVRRVEAKPSRRMR